MSNIYNLRLHTGMELITEMLTIDDINEIDPGVAKLFTDDESDDTVILSHPIVVMTVPVSRDGDMYLENMYHPYLHHAKHACVALHNGDILSIDELHPDAQPDYIEAVIAVYGHLYDDAEDKNQDQSDTPTVH